MYNLHLSNFVSKRNEIPSAPKINYIYGSSRASHRNFICSIHVSSVFNPNFYYFYHLPREESILPHRVPSFRKGCDRDHLLISKFDFFPEHTRSQMTYPNERHYITMLIASMHTWSSVATTSRHPIRRFARIRPP